MMTLPKKLTTMSSTEVTLKIISLLASRKKIGVRELARELNVAPSTSLRFLRTFVESGFAILQEDSKTYQPGMQLIKIAAQIGKEITILDMAKSELERLFAQTQQTINLGILDQNMQHILHIDKVVANGVIKIDTPLGEEAPSYCTALGKAILAFKQKPLLDQVIRQFQFTKFTPNTISDPATLYAELAQIKEQGYAIDREEYTPHLICIAAPIFQNDEAIASISLSTLSLENRDIVQQYAEAIKEAARRISAKLSPEY